MGPVKSVHEDDVRSHNNLVTHWKRFKKWPRKRKKVGPGGCGKDADSILKGALTMDITGSGRLGSKWQLQITKMLQGLPEISDGETARGRGILLQESAKCAMCTIHLAPYIFFIHLW